jgi:hypothetical protein
VHAQPVGDGPSRYDLVPDQVVGFTAMHIRIAGHDCGRFSEVLPGNGSYSATAEGSRNDAVLWRQKMTNQFGIQPVPQNSPSGVAAPESPFCPAVGQGKAKMRLVLNAAGPAFNCTGLPRLLLTRGLRPL